MKDGGEIKKRGKNQMKEEGKKKRGRRWSPFCEVAQLGRLSELNGGLGGRRAQVGIQPRVPRNDFSG